MEHKDKANELFDKYFSELSFPSECEGCMQCIDKCGIMTSVAKKYALITVDEIINAIDWHEFETPNEQLKYWQEVKLELQKL